MPVMDGLKLVSLVRGNAAYKDIPIIMITTEGAEEDKKEGTCHRCKCLSHEADTDTGIDEACKQSLYHESALTLRAKKSSAKPWCLMGKIRDQFKKERSLTLPAPQVIQLEVRGEFSSHHKSLP